MEGRVCLRQFIKVRFCICSPAVALCRRGLCILKQKSSTLHHHLSFSSAKDEPSQQPPSPLHHLPHSTTSHYQQLQPARFPRSTTRTTWPDPHHPPICPRPVPPLESEVQLALLRSYKHRSSCLIAPSVWDLYTHYCSPRAQIGQQRPQHKTLWHQNHHPTKCWHCRYCHAESEPSDSTASRPIPSQPLLQPSRGFRVKTREARPHHASSRKPLRSHLHVAHKPVKENMFPSSSPLFSPDFDAAERER